MAIKPLTTTKAVEGINTHCAIAANNCLALANSADDARFAIRLMTRQAANPPPNEIAAMSCSAFVASRSKRLPFMP